FGKAVETLEVPECTSFGAAILGAVAAGAFGSAEEAVKRLVRPKETIHPRAENNEIYNRLFHIFEDCYHALREANIYSRLAQLQDQF
ncbi:MAG: xylulose kinase, partial [Deltaproteobacteria bacterium]